MQEGDLILGTVESVTNTITFVKLINGQTGTIVSSEIAPGRIKHMRAYVVPNKKIVCKVLRNDNGHVHLSLRRVNSKEKKEFLQKWKNEQALSIAFKQALGTEEEKIKKEILNDFKDLSDFLDSARKDISILEKYLPYEKSETIRKIIEKKKKKQELKNLIKIKCMESDGIKRIKKIFDLDEADLSINYVSAGNFRLTLSVDDFKTGKKKMQEILEEIEKRAKENNCEFFCSEEK